MTDDHDARITANEDDLDDTRATCHVHGRRLDHLERLVSEMQAVLRRMLSS